jgi:DNA-directed RNA polymerase subunit beta'
MRKATRFREIYETTPGRMLIAELLPKHHEVPFDVQQADDQEGNLQDDRHVYRACGQKETVIFCDRIMGLGFKNACNAGISFGMDDMVIPDTKQKLVAETRDHGDRIRAAVQ